MDLPLSLDLLVTAILVLLLAAVGFAFTLALDPRKRARLDAWLVEQERKDRRR